MSYNPQDKDFLIEVAKGNVVGHSLVNKFGFNELVGTTLVPVTTGGMYATPSTAQVLEILSDDANDTALGTGAREITITGLDASWNEQVITVAMNGTAPVAVPGTWLRVYRAAVSGSGTYATATAGSHAGDVTIRGTGAGATWAIIAVTDSGFPAGQTEIAAYTVPAGFTGYLLDKHTTVNTAKEPPDIIWFRRENADTAVAPFSAMRVFERHTGVSTEVTYHPHAAAVTLPEKTDVGVMAHVTSLTTAISVEFQLLLVAD
jgi:hypothetical protein